MLNRLLSHDLPRRGTIRVSFRYRKLAFVLHIVAEGKNRDDEQHRQQTIPQRAFPPHICPGAHPDHIHKAKDSPCREQPGRAAIGSVPVAPVNPVDPSRLEVEEIENKIADV
jgi:hypothetical protein